MFGRPYTVGDIIAAFYGVLFGLKSMERATNNIKYVREG
jgi:hypothetical protein